MMRRTVYAFTFFNIQWLTDAGWPWTQQELDRQVILGAMLKALLATQPGPDVALIPGEQYLYSLRN